MYLPYLRGKQYELIALREFAEGNPNNSKIMPIIEPVKSTYSSMNTAVCVMFDKGLKFALILNPTNGDFRRKECNILSEMPILKVKDGEWTPAFIVNGNNLNEISSFMDSNSFNDTMLIIKDTVDFDEIETLLSNDNVKYIVTADTSRAIMRKFEKIGKEIIRLDNNFTEQKRNADYLKISEDRFTEEHSYYKKEGFWGISDYTALPKDFIDGGMLPYAIAIHLTYEKTADEIFVRHFVSDSNEDQSNIQKKFKEAASKAEQFYTAKPKTNAVSDLINILEEDKYPGLGVIKKLSIRNHIELMNSLIP